MINIDNISFDHCIKCTVCTVYCPVARATHFFPGPKQSGPDAERLRIKNPELVDKSLSYCSNCKRCEIACPSNVRIADIIQSSKWKYFKKRFRVRDYFLARTDLLGSLATRLSFLVNLFTGFFPIKFLLEKFLKIPSKRIFPKYENGTFHGWYKKQKKHQENFKNKVIYFHGCYVDYNHHELGRDLIKVLNAMNIGVLLTTEKCCGVPLIANGYVENARKNALFNISSLGRSVRESGLRIVTTSSSCNLALKHEYPNLLELDNSAIVNHLDFITRFLCMEFDKGNLPAMKPMRIKAAYHSPCHLERMGLVMNTIDVLKKIPGLDLHILHSECCGMAGTYGFKSEFYNVSQKIGKELFDIINKASPDIVITDCESCKWQIEMNTPYKVMHPVSLLAMAIA
ncbi:MAG: anaerobic glycerol-3-phosphate dehydrogenase subunit C [Spirochaetes bacterium]|nr:anaerobic glycerol-3-phosphate dehydrogenase subunit C [Spirochaetota bacterium]